MNGKAVVFDLDGTLLDTLDDLADSANHVLGQRGLPTHPVDEFRNFIGEGVGMLIRQMLPDDRRDEQTMAEILAAYRAEYGRRWNAKTRPYDGVAELLDALAARGVKMAVLSNKPDEFTQKCVAGLLGSWEFDPVLGHRDGTPRKPDPAGALQIARHWGLPPAEILYVGDTATDVQTAVAAGMCAVGVMWGFRPSELESSGAEALIERPGELLDLVGSGR